ncbi:MAG TPA: dynamin family protein, partial [Limnochordia bacterium]|nr:dynamin family protein [Limnochordia bacterium]
MPAHEELERILAWTKASPLRTAGTVPGFAPSEPFRAIPGQIESAIGRLDDTLTIAVMGEVKAGKSTLINALVGRAVAPTNVLEATAAVMEIVHGDDAGALVHWQDQPAEQ